MIHEIIIIFDINNFKAELKERLIFHTLIHDLNLKKVRFLILFSFIFAIKSFKKCFKLFTFKRK